MITALEDDSMVNGWVVGRYVINEVFTLRRYETPFRSSRHFDDAINTPNPQTTHQTAEGNRYRRDDEPPQNQELEGDLGAEVRYDCMLPRGERRG